MMTPTPSGHDAHILLRAFCDELARCGLRHACTSPGSRCAPILLALAREPRIRCWSHVDERCAGFFALGVAKASGRPAAITCTSGTAAAELMPAVVEAREARVPLIVLTADRPPELRDVGAGQAIDQLGIYGSAAKWFFELGTHEATSARVAWCRALACRAYWTAIDGRPGAVHINVALREPLTPGGPLDAAPAPLRGREDGAPWLARSPRPPASGADELAALLRERPRTVIVAGRWERDEATPAAVARFAEAFELPLLADPLSGARRGAAAIAHYDALLRDERWAADHAPELVLRVGDLPTSKPLRRWLAGLRGAVAQVAFDPEGAWQDPDAAVTRVLEHDPAATLQDLASAAPPPAGGAWLERWTSADGAAAAAIEDALSLGPELSEPQVAAWLGATLEPDATLVVASSMPVRDVETFFPADRGLPPEARAPIAGQPPRVLCNRGANGIDGTVSTAFGVAAASGGPVVALIGDVALAYDIGGLLAARRLGLDLTIVVLDNGGGGIFHFLPVAAERDAFEEHVATPHGLDFAHAAALYGCAHERVAGLEGLRAALARGLRDGAGTAIIEVPGDRERNVELHERVWERVREALAANGSAAAAGNRRTEP